MKIVLATDNLGKLRELRTLLAPLGIEVAPQSDFGIETPQETGTTFEANALLKARHAAIGSGYAALADDSGLEVDALCGRPGVYSARYAGPQATDALNNQKLLDELRDVPFESRTARYRCVLALVRSPADREPLICEAAWEGRIVEAPRGTDGFGYDPLFQPEQQKATAAELSAATKNQLSHRGKALQQMVQALQRTVIDVK